MSHHCHFPNCGRKTPAKLWGCRVHWYMLSAELQKLIWRTYRPGQEIDKRPSREYIEAARRVQDWIKANLAEEVQRLYAMKAKRRRWAAHRQKELRL